MSELSIILNEFLKEEPIIIYKPIYASMFGSVSAGLLVGALTYWSKTMKHGKFYKTDEELCCETGMKIKQLRAAKKQVVDFGVFSIEVKSLPARTYYQINLSRFTSLIKKHATKTGKQDCLKQANWSVQNRQTSCLNEANQSAQIRHTTSEIKAEINTETNTITNHAREQASKIEVIELPKAEPSINLPVDRVCVEPVLGEIPKERPEPKATAPCSAKTKSASERNFELFWLAYVLKVGKGAARKAFERAEKKFELQATESPQSCLSVNNASKTFVDVILAALEVQKIERERRAELGLWTPNWKHPATWLNQECWHDVTKSFDLLQKEAEEKRVMKHSVTQGKPSYADKVQAANIATGNIIEKFYPDLAKHFPAFAPETKQSSSTISLRQEVVINAIQ